MSDVALASGLIAARTAQVQLAVAAKMLRMNAAAERSVVKIIDAAQQNAERLAASASGIGGNLDIRA